MSCQLATLILFFLFFLVLATIKALIYKGKSPLNRERFRVKQGEIPG